MRFLGWGRLVLLVLVARSTPLRADSDSWSPYAPLTSPKAPAVSEAAWARSPVDAFVYAALQRQGLEPAPAVDRRVWLRRVTFDLTGLPPTPDELERFLADPRPDEAAYDHVVRRLLASPRYGERWARHWLDVVRYADSDGFAIDGARPTLWRYRDYVVRTFNEDVPIDRFIREQLAGDELDAGTAGAVATGFFRLGPWEADNMVPQVKRQDYLNEVTNTIGSVFLGLTFGCARCHNHKYDPIPTRDYYRLQAFVAPLRRSERGAPLEEAELTPHVRRQRQRLRDAVTAAEATLALFRADLKLKVAEALGSPAMAVTDEQLNEALTDKSRLLTSAEKKRHGELDAALKELHKRSELSGTSCAVSNPGDDKVPETRILRRGNITSPGPEVLPGFPGAVPLELPRQHERLQEVADKAKGRRRLLADWIASPENPLTLRVFVNRVWQYHMGRGIVATANDFGENGSGASHPELLDRLAGELLAAGWRLKPLHRLIVLSRAYRTSTVHPRHAECAAVDPENKWLWRGHFRRLESEALRDALLAVSGRLLETRGGPGFREAIPAEMGTSFPFFTWRPSSTEERRRRSLYIFQRRNLIVPILEAFDGPDMNESCERRRTSVTTPQVFALFNGSFVHDVSAHFARRVLAEAGTDRRRQVERVFLLAFARRPDATEMRAALSLLDDQLRLHRESHGHAPGKAGLAAAELAALKDLCLVAVNANEFIYLE